MLTPLKGEIMEKFKQFISHYKWYLLIIVFFTIVISVMIAQMLTRDEYDVSVMYAGPAILADSHNAQIEKALGKLAEDTDGDGKKEAVLYDLVIMTEKEIQEAHEKGYSSSSLNFDTVQDAREAFQLNILSDDHFVLLLSPEQYSIMKSNNALEKLSDIGITTQAGSDEYCVRFKDTSFARFYPCFAVIPDDTVLCFKKMSEVNENKKKIIKRRQVSVEYIKSMLAFELPEGAVLAGDGEQ